MATRLEGVAAGRRGSFDADAAKNLSKTKAELSGINKNKSEEMRLKRNLVVLEREKRANININKTQEKAMKDKLERLKKAKEKSHTKLINESNGDDDDDFEIPSDAFERRRSTIGSKPSTAKSISASSSANNVNLTRDSHYDMYGRRNTCTALGIRPDKLRELTSAGGSNDNNSISRRRLGSGSHTMKRSVTESTITDVYDGYRR